MMHFDTLWAILISVRVKHHQVKGTI